MIGMLQGMQKFSELQYQQQLQRIEMLLEQPVIQEKQK